MSVSEWIFARSLALGDHVQHRMYGDRKRRLFRDLTGTVVEIGPGTGVNVPYFPADLQWIGLEPNPYMHDFLYDRFAEHPIDAQVRSEPAQDTSLPDDCADAVVSTLVLCSVPDVDDALTELRRILKPEGRLLFIEHVAAPSGSWLCSCQRSVRPLWRRLFDGCHPDRHTERTLRDRFSTVTVEQFRTGLPVVSPHIVGEAAV